MGELASQICITRPDELASNLPLFKQIRMNMKTLFFFRMPALVVLLLVAALTGCKKGSNTDPAPDLAGRVAGQYTFSELTAAGKTYPASQTNLKGTITVARQTANTVSVKASINLKSTNEVYADDLVDDVTVTETGGGNIEFQFDGTVIARGTGSKISIEGEGADGVSFTLTASK